MKRDMFDANALDFPFELAQRVGMGVRNAWFFVVIVAAENGRPTDFIF